MRHPINRRGFSIPMVLLFCAFMVVVLVSFVYTRINMKQQTKISFRQLKAHYLAQSGIQHALLKLRILPNESFEAACLARGICPFVPAGTPAGSGGQKQQALLDEFITDLDMAVYPTTFGDTEFRDWAYKITTMTAIMAEKDADTRIHAVEIVSGGSAKVNFKGTDVTTVDEVRRVVKVSRNR